MVTETAEGHPVLIAQHATATYCRGWISKWHGIRKRQGVNQKEGRFFCRVDHGMNR